MEQKRVENIPGGVAFDDMMEVKRREEDEKKIRENQELQDKKLLLQNKKNTKRAAKTMSTKHTTPKKGREKEAVLGYPTRVMVNDEKLTVLEDQQAVHYEVVEWTIVDHGVDQADNIPKFKTICGRKRDGRDIFYWSTKENLNIDEVPALEPYILANCNELPYTAKLKETKKKKGELGEEKEEEAAPKREPCGHGDYMNEAEWKYTIEGNSGYCKKGSYLHGIKCAGACGGRTFVEKGTGPGVVVPTTQHPAYICAEFEGMCGKTNAKEGEVECRQAVCGPCWDTKLKAQPDSGANGSSGKTRRSKRGKA